MKSWMFGFNREPVAIATFIRLALLAGISFGLNLTDVQMVSLMAAVEAGLGLAVRQNVTSQQTLHEAGTTQLNIVNLAEANRSTKNG